MATPGTNKPASRRGWLEHIHLIWLVGLFWQAVYDPGFGWVNILVTLGGLIIFLTLYMLAHAHPYSRSERLRNIGIFAALGLLTAPFNSWSSVYLIFAAGTAGYLQPLRLAYRVIWILVGCMPVFAGLVVWSGTPPWLGVSISIMVSFFVLGIGLSSIQEAQQRRLNAQIQAAQEENQRLAAIAERERIARDLHDLLGHTLSVITLKAELAAKLAQRDPQKAALEMREVERISREATAQVREAVQGYKSRGLQGELAGVKLALEAAGIKFDYYAQMVELSPVQEGVLALALREAVTNIIRHSGAKQCTIQLTQMEHGVGLEIQDDGKGGAFKENSGLAGMRQRVEGLGGSLSLDTSGGTKLSIGLPHQQPAPSFFGTLSPETGSR